MQYKNLPQVNFTSNKQLDDTVENLRTARLELIKETVDSFLLDIDDSGEIKKTIYNNKLVPAPFLSMISHTGFDESLIQRYGTGNLWIRSVCKVGKWYQYNVLTCNKNKEYSCDILPNTTIKVKDTHHSFFNTCLLVLAYNVNKDICTTLSTKEINFAKIAEEGDDASILRDLGFRYIKIENPSDLYYSLDYRGQDVQFGDIVFYAEDKQTDIKKDEEIETDTTSKTLLLSKNYAEIFFGSQDEIEYNNSVKTEWKVGTATTNYAAMNWLEIHDGKKNNFGMPCPVNQFEYNGIWRYCNFDGMLFSTANLALADESVDTSDFGTWTGKTANLLIQMFGELPDKFDGRCCNDRGKHVPAPPLVQNNMETFSVQNHDVNLILPCMVS